MNGLWAVEISWVNGSGYVETGIVFVRADSAYGADQKALEAKAASEDLVARGAWPWTTGHRWLVAGEEYVG